MSANPDTAAPTGRNKPAQGKERGDAALGHASQNSSPEGAKQGGELPRGWSEQRIEQLFAPLEDGRTLHQGWSPQCDKIPSPSEDVWGVLKTTSIQAGEFQPEHNKLLPPGLEPRPMIEVKEGDILLTCAGPRVRCGVSCLVRQTRKRLMMSGKMYRFRVDVDRTDARYVEAFLQTERARQAIDKMKTGSSDSGLNLTHERFRQLLVPVAPLPEQRRIVAEIEKQFTRLEAGVAALRRVQANHKRYRAAVLKAACEGRLVPTEAALARSPRSTKNGHPAYETGEALLARILTERRQNWQGRGQYKEPVAPDTTNLPPSPDGWTWASVEQIGRIETGSTPPKAETANYGNEVPLVKPGELLDYPVGKAADNLTRQGADVATTAPAESVLVSCIGNLGKTALTVREVAFNQQINAIIPTLSGTARWTFYAVQQRAFRQQLESVASATTISIVNKSKFSALIVPLPPLAEQTRIVAEVERRLSVVDELESVVTANLQRATRLRQSILQKAFTGGLSERSMKGNY